MKYKKLANDINNYYNDIKNDSFNESKWLEKGRIIKSNIYNFEKLDKYLFDSLNKFKEIVDPKIDEILSVEALLIKTSEKTNDYIKTMKEKTKDFNGDFELDFENENEVKNDYQNKELVLDILNNQKLLENRRREFENFE